MAETSRERTVGFERSSALACQPVHVAKSFRDAELDQRSLARIFSAVAMAFSVIACADEKLSSKMAEFQEATSECHRSLCYIDFLDNEACQKAWKMHTNLPQAKNRADELAYLQGRLILDRAYQRALEKRLGQSHYSRYECTKALAPLEAIEPDAHEMANEARLGPR